MRRALVGDLEQPLEGDGQGQAFAAGVEHRRERFGGGEQLGS
jgi:hypothetical protein